MKVHSGKLKISDKRSWWNGRVVKILFNDHNDHNLIESRDHNDHKMIESRDLYDHNNDAIEPRDHNNHDMMESPGDCLLVKFQGYSDPYPFNLTRWKNQVSGRSFLLHRVVNSKWCEIFRRTFKGQVRAGNFFRKFPLRVKIIKL